MNPAPLDFDGDENNIPESISINAQTKHRLKCAPPAIYFPAYGRPIFRIPRTE
jgi:hypothetical protein